MSSYNDGMYLKKKKKILLANNREYPYTHLLYTKSCSHIVVQDNSSEFMLEEQVR